MNTIMAHMIAGYPHKEGFREAVRGLREGGASILELQIPFSDPTADGPIITRACEDAIAGGFKVDDVWEYIQIAQAEGFEDIYVMSYANIPFRYGVEKFVSDMKDKGIAGLIIPDLPIEDEEQLYALCKKKDIAGIPVLVPNMTRERIALFRRKKFEKVYISLRAGITGSKTVITPALKTFLKQFDDYVSFGGFGVQSKAQVDALSPFVDAVVVGSFFTKTIQDACRRQKSIYRAIKQSTLSLF